MRFRPRTIRQRTRRAKKGQVAAVATILGLLLVVTFISQFVIAPLPAEMAAVEFQHIVQVENQLARLQQTVLAEASRPAVPLALSSPVTLGSGSMPPWAGPSGGTLGPELTTVKIAGAYQVAQVFANPPNWNVGSSCISGGQGKCAGNGNVDTWNVTNANNTNFTLKVTGNSNSLAYNISGNNDTVNIDWTGGDTGYVKVIVNGSDDVVTLAKGGSDTTSPVITFLFYGERDTFNYNPSGSHSSKGSVTIFVDFIGSMNQICPYGNASATDTLGTLAAGGSNLNFTATWYNALGLDSGPTKTTYPGGSGSNEYLYFQNISGVVGCAFTKEYASSYSQQYDSGIVVHLLNHYEPQTDVAYDQGAVIETAEGGQSIMVSPPSISYTVNPQGLSAKVVLINLVGTLSVVGGTETSAVTTQVNSVSAISIVNGRSNLFLSSALYFNVTTFYPAAWYNYFASLPQLVPAGPTCTTLHALPSGYSCLAPPTGTPERISAAFGVQDLTLETITVSASVE